MGKQYFDELQSFSCEVNFFCEDLLIGDMCCYDFTAEFTNVTEVVSKKCCSNEARAIVPGGEVSDSHIAMVEMAMKTIPTEETQIICNQFDYQTMEKLSSCLVILLQQQLQLLPLRLQQKLIQQQQERHLKQIQYRQLE